MVSKHDLSAALTLGVAVPLPAADTEVLKQRLDVLVVAAEAAEEKAATARRCILAARQLLDEEQAALSISNSRPPSRSWSPDPRLSRPQRPRPLLRRTPTPSSPTSTSRRIP
jgi:hypothetical protein